MGAAVVLALTGCAPETSEPADQATATPSSTTVRQPATAAEPSAQIPAGTPAVSEAAETPAVPAPLPAESLPVETAADNRPHGEQLYLETCRQFKTAIDAIAVTGAATREQSVTGLTEKLQSGPSWSTLSDDDQQQILRGLDAAGRGAC
ncbi:hypothetical protein SAMN05421642_103223 [Rhodococcoides kyotonense]|uniref:Uncharacterized protein n=2 Tax=Rhodococcoides kyotonense TaxID=398843 RepID=A0A239FBN1_9NOCA|nr:hypothetical protein SAMN05421642_103223 [Rhodococcus kyotonensis]